MKMITTRVASAMLITGIGLVSCQKTLDSKSVQSTNANDLQKVTDFAASQSFINVADAAQFAFTVDPKFAAKDAALVGSCPPITTYDPSPDVYPHTVTIDWGTGCTSGSITRSGKWITKYTGDMSVIGSSATTTYDNFYYNGVKFEGKLKIANNRETEYPHGVYRITQKDRKIIETNGDYIIYSGYRRIVKRDDNPVYPGFPDGSFRVTGTIAGDEMKGGISYQWLATIDKDNPLIYYYYDFICRGQADVTFTNQDPWHVNYGNTNTCDDQAELTINGVTTTVTLPLSF